MLLLIASRRVAPSLRAQVSSYGDKQTGPANDQAASILEWVGIAQHLNQQLAARL